MFERGKHGHELSATTSLGVLSRQLSSLAYAGQRGCYDHVWMHVENFSGSYFPQMHNSLEVFCQSCVCVILTIHRNIDIRC